MKFFKKSTALLLAFLMLAGMLTGFAADEELPLKEKQYEDYGTYVLLGDSVASGYNDVEYVFSEFTRVENSYADFVADDLGIELIPLACPGFRTLELRHLLEDNFPVEDGYLFHGSHTPNEEIEALAPYFRQSISEAGLITLGIGGNDFGAYLGWVIADVMEEDGLFTDFVTKARALLAEKGVESDALDDFLDLADTMGVLPNVISILPEALDYGISSLFNNWDPMIEDIYRLNPDVTLLVIGMFDTGVKTEEDVAKNEKALIKLNIAQAIVDFANGPMKKGAEKYGYTFVDVTGTICDETHPTAEGHRFIADKILEALPDVNFPYTDVEYGSTYYQAVAYMYENDIMKGTTATLFSPKGAFTKKHLAEALYAKAGRPEVDADSITINDVADEDVAKPAIVWAIKEGIMSLDVQGNFGPNEQYTKNGLTVALFSAAIAEDSGFLSVIRALFFLFGNISLAPTQSVTRGKAAMTLLDYFRI